MSSVMEYDLDSYIRKYKDSLTCFREPNGGLSFSWVSQCGEDRKFYNEKNEVIKMSPIYYRFRSGYYLGRDRKTILCLLRQPEKNYKVGLSNTSNYFFRYCPINKSFLGYGDILGPNILEVFDPNALLNDPTTIEISSEERLFVLSKDFLMTGRKIFYRKTPVALFSRDTIYIVDTSLVDELKFLLVSASLKESQWKIESLSELQKSPR
jgi:hypothetical protein